MAGARCCVRLASYAVIAGDHDRFAFVRSSGRLFLVGGGREHDESPEETLRREAREECGRDIEIESRIGEAIQHFSAEGVDYKMHATIFAATFIGDATAASELELVWLTEAQAKPQLYHECHGWALGEYRCQRSRAF